ncbi:MAG: alpha-L-fucosidase [Cyclobacteriaceae bacterium]
MKKVLILLVLLLALSQKNVAQEKIDPKAQWFVDDRFGMFIHFGLYSIPAGMWKGEVMGRNMYAEWIQKQGNWPYGLTDKEYQALAGQFNPHKFDAESWVTEAKNAGMKYMLITAKHHDGFALWPSKVSDFNVMDATPFKRDILGELAEACKKHGLKLGFYYSHYQEWHHPGGAHPPVDEFKSIPPPLEVTHKEFEEYWQQKCLPQVRELIKNYQPAFMWFDTWGKPELITDKRLDELIALVRKLDPNVLINSRILMKHPDIEDKVDFISMGDNSFPTEKLEKPWETSGTMNHSWGYHQLDFDWEQTEGLLKKLVGNVSRNGNFQLNIGPKADGTFPAPSVRRLREIGAWMYVNGEAIYQTEANPYQEQNWGYITKKATEQINKIYLHVANWPENGILHVNGIPYLPEKIYVLETGEELGYLPDHNSVKIKLPVHQPDQRVTVLVMEMKKEY